MLFMTVYTYEPKHRDEIIRRRLEQGALVPSGMKMLGEWSYAGSGRVFRLVEAEDPMLIFEATHPWTDVGAVEVYPVVEVEQLLPRMAERRAAASQG